MVTVRCVIALAVSKGDNIELIAEAKEVLHKQFKLQDLGELKFFLGIEVLRSKAGVILNQRKYVLELISHMALSGAKHVTTPLELNWKLTTLDYDQATSLSGYNPISDIGSYQILFMQSSKQSHWKATVRVVRYLKGTIGQGVWLQAEVATELTCWCDSDWAACLNTRRSVTSYVIKFGESLISWKSKKQQIVLRSSAEDEYRSMASSVAEVTWLLGLFKELGVSIQLPVIVLSDKLSFSRSHYNRKIDSNSILFQLTHLQSLNLSGNDFSNSHISPNFGKFSSLTHLDLSYSDFSSEIPPEISHLYKLHSLFLSSYRGLKLGPLSFKFLLQTLTQLREVDLDSVQMNFPKMKLGPLSFKFILNGYFPKTKWNSSASIMELELPGVNFSSNLPESIGCLTSLVYLSLGYCNLSGPIPKSLWDLTHVEYLNLGNNHLEGSIPLFTSGLQNLKTLSLSGNSLNGAIPSWIFSLPSLTYLGLGSNSFSGQLEDFQSNLLVDISLEGNKLQGYLPKSIRNLVNLEMLHFSSNNFSGKINVSFFSNLKKLEELNLSHNSISLINFLYLARNNLKGAIPQCLGNMSDQLEFLDMQHNSFSGDLQTTFGLRSGLKSFNLHGNKLEGKIPRSLANCKQLEVLDLGNNHLNDTFPMWLGILPKLRVLSLRSNKLHGPIRASRSMKLFPKLRMLDLSCNAFTAEILTSLFHNLKAMKRIYQTAKGPNDDYYEDSVTVVTKGQELEVVRILSLYTTMDLSINKFEGQIRSMIGDLIALRVLNLSHNGLQGHIPTSLGKLSVVESFDLSFNQLSGDIPETLASLTSLAVLNLSRNNLQGCIPGGPQFATFQNNSYEGNDGLRGFPLSKDCGSSWRPESDSTTGVLDQENNSMLLSELSWKVVLMGYGSGLFIGSSIAYFLLSSRNSNWLSRIADDLEYIIIVRRRKKQLGQRRYRRRNNDV
ncbi:putative cytochrome 82C2-like [Capsicum annuum]|nr:putative cytochrome 82C2-like [Capsicum annuum]